MFPTRRVLYLFLSILFFFTVLEVSIMFCQKNLYPSNLHLGILINLFIYRFKFIIEKLLLVTPYFPLVNIKPIEIKKYDNPDSSGIHVCFLRKIFFSSSPFVIFAVAYKQSWLLLRIQTILSLYYICRSLSYVTFEKHTYTKYLFKP